MWQIKYVYTDIKTYQISENNGKKIKEEKLQVTDNKKYTKYLSLTVFQI